jgi:hypothetical protein
MMWFERILCERCMGIYYKIGKGDQVLDLGESMIQYTQKVALSSIVMFLHINARK